jgi:rhodanese-related sulfurtransferase
MPRGEIWESVDGSYGPSNCNCHTGRASARDAHLLQTGGFENVGALLGGNAAWEASGGEMVKAPPPALGNASPEKSVTK